MEELDVSMFQNLPLPMRQSLTRQGIPNLLSPEEATTVRMNVGDEVGQVTTNALEGGVQVGDQVGAQVEILEGTGVTDQATAAAMLPVGLSGVQRKIVTRLSDSPNPQSQAQLARDLGKSRTTVNSAIGILRKRGIVNQGSLSLAPHLDSLGMSNVEYPWLDIRQEYA